MVVHMSDREIDALRRGGHDLRKLYAAFAASRAHTGAPTVILAKTKKGFGMGGAGESRMTAHQTKKLDIDALRAFRDRFHLPLSNEQVESLAFLRPAPDSAEMRYLHERRARLGGFMPQRTSSAMPIATPALAVWGGFALAPEGKSMSTTMAFVRCLSNLLRDPTLGPRIVPIVADEARTFGMASLFRQVGIYSPDGQQYEPEDAGSMLSYREAADGQLLEEGITEAGALASWTAAATAYSIHGHAMLPFYIYYSMFGFQRVGDLIWAAADQRARGFLIGATAGRTTLSGEGLQHQDGTSPLIAATVPNCRVWDPSFAGELAVIIDYGMRRMLSEQVDEFHYITVGNQNYLQLPVPEQAHPDIIRGMYRVAIAAQDADTPVQVRLLGSGAIMTEVLAAADLLREHWQIHADVFSVTSYSELAREARQLQRQQMLGLDDEQAEPISHLQRLLAGTAPVIAASDYVRAVAQQIAEYLPAPFTSLGTDGFGRSDTRAALRTFFDVDRHAIVLGALNALRREGLVDQTRWRAALARHAGERDGQAPWSR